MPPACTPAWSNVWPGWRRVELHSVRARCLLASIDMKSQLVALTTLVLAIGCGQKQADGTYHVKGPTTAAKADIEKLRRNAAQACEELKRYTQLLTSQTVPATDEDTHSTADQPIAKN